MTTTFQNLDPAEVADYAEQLAGLINERYPHLNLRRGSVLYSLLVEKAAAAHVYESVAIEELRNTWNLLDIQEDPENVSNELVDRVLSNFNAQRSPGIEATGRVKIVIRRRQSMTITAGTRFISGSQVFSAPTDFRVVLSEDDIFNDTDRLLVTEGAERHVFTVSVVANEPGEQGNLPVNTPLDISPTPTFFVESVAAEDFIGGQDPETSAQVIDRVKSGLTAKMLSGVSHSKERLKEAVPGLVDSSVVGMQDPEMVRDHRTILGLSSGGHCDVYARTQNLLDIHRIDGVTAEIVSNERKTIALSRNQLTGVYRVHQVLRRDEQGDIQVPITNQVWERDVENVTNPPLTRSAFDAAFTSYQKATIEIEDFQEGVEYDVLVYRMPLISNLQEFVNDPEHRDPLASWLIKSCVPAITGIEINLQMRPGKSVDVEQIRKSVVDAVNRHSFVSSLSSSVVVNAVQNHIGSSGHIDMPINMIAEIIQPDRTSHWIRGENRLVVPNEPQSGLSPKTVAFFTSPDRVDIKVSLS